MAIAESVDGIAQVAEIVRAMKVFSHQEPGRTQVSVNLRTAISSSDTSSSSSVGFLASM